MKKVRRDGGLTGVPPEDQERQERIRQRDAMARRFGATNGYCSEEQHVRTLQTIRFHNAVARRRVHAPTRVRAPRATAHRRTCARTHRPATRRTARSRSSGGGSDGCSSGDGEGPAASASPRAIGGAA